MGKPNLLYAFESECSLKIRHFMSIFGVYEDGKADRRRGKLPSLLAAAGVGTKPDLTLCFTTETI